METPKAASRRDDDIIAGHMRCDADGPNWLTEKALTHFRGRLCVFVVHNCAQCLFFNNTCSK